MKALVKPPALTNSGWSSNKYFPDKKKENLDEMVWTATRQRSRAFLRAEAIKALEKDWLIISPRGTRQWKWPVCRKTIRETAFDLAKKWFEVEK